MKRARIVFAISSVLLLLLAPGHGIAQATGLARLQEGIDAFMRGDVEAAADRFAEAAELDPSSAESRLWAARAEAALGRLDEAALRWEQVLRLAPDNEAAKSALAVLKGERAEPQAYLQVAEQLLAADMPEPALRQLDQIRLGGLGDDLAARVRLTRARALADLQRGPEAMAEVERLRASHSGWEELPWTLLVEANVERTFRKDPFRAQRTIEKLLAGSPAPALAAEALLEQAYALRDAGDCRAAARILRTLLADHPSFARANTARLELATLLADIDGPEAPAPTSGPLKEADRECLELLRTILAAPLESGRLGRANVVALRVLERYDQSGNCVTAREAAERLRADLPPGNHLGAPLQFRIAGWHLIEAERAFASAFLQGADPSEAMLKHLEASVGAIVSLAEPGSGAKQPRVVDELVALVRRVEALSNRIPMLQGMTELRPGEKEAVNLLTLVLSPDWTVTAPQAKVSEILVPLLDRYGASESWEAGIPVATRFEPLLTEQPARAQLQAAMAQLYIGRGLRHVRDAARQGRQETISEPNADVVAGLEKAVAALGEESTREDGVRTIEGAVATYREAGRCEPALEIVRSVQSSLPRSERAAWQLREAELLVSLGTGQLRERQAAAAARPDRIEPEFGDAVVVCARLVDSEPRAPQAEPARVLIAKMIGLYEADGSFDLARRILAALQAVEGGSGARSARIALLELGNLELRSGTAELRKLNLAYRSQLDDTIPAGFLAAREAWTRLVVEWTETDEAAEARALLQAVGIQLEGAGQPLRARHWYDLLLGQPDLWTEVGPVEYRRARTEKLVADMRFAEREDPKAAPAALLPEDEKALDALARFAAKFPESELRAAAMDDVVMVARRYGEAGAWEVAGQVCARLLDAGIEARHPERVHFLVVACSLGELMPEHALEILGRFRVEEPARAPAGEREGEAYGVDELSAGVGSALDLARAAGLGDNGRERHRLSESRGQSVATFYADPVASSTDGTMLIAMANQALDSARALAALREPAFAAGQGQARQLQPALGPPQSAEAQPQQPEGPPLPVLSPEEKERLRAAAGAAFDGFREIRDSFPDSLEAEAARNEMLAVIEQMRAQGLFETAANLGLRFLETYPADPQAPDLAHRMARDLHTFAVQGDLPRESDEAQALLHERFEIARRIYGEVAEEFGDEHDLVRAIRRNLAETYHDEANRLAAQGSPRARVLLTRAFSAWREVAAEMPHDTLAAEAPDRMLALANEMAARNFHEEALEAYTEFASRYPAHHGAASARWRIAEIHRDKLQDPLRAAEAFQEWARAFPGQDVQAAREQMFAIGRMLFDQQRWVESLHVLGSFVDSFPADPRSGESLNLMGKVHQANLAWDEAIGTYERALDEYPEGPWLREARLAIAECHIHLSHWGTVIGLYEQFVRDFPEDAKTPEIDSRIASVKDLERFQLLVDQTPPHRKAADAQYEIGEILNGQLKNPRKAVQEYANVVERFPDSHLADDAQYRIGRAELALSEKEKARESLILLVETYPDSPLADDALSWYGQSFEQEAAALGEVTRERAKADSNFRAQEFAYKKVLTAVRELNEGDVAELKALRKAGQIDKAEMSQAAQQSRFNVFLASNVALAAEEAEQYAEVLTAAQLANRQDRINAALRRAVEAYRRAARDYPVGDTADQSLLRMAEIYEQKLRDEEQAMVAYEQITKVFRGSSVAEDAAWKIAGFYERKGRHGEAVDAYGDFIRNYPQSGRVGSAQFAMAETLEKLDRWVEAMDAYTTYVSRFPDGPLTARAREQINWIKAYRL